MYYLGLNGIRFLKQLTVTNDDGEEAAAYAIEELRKRYKEPTRSQTFIDRCILIADCGIALEQADKLVTSSQESADDKKARHSSSTHYYYQTEADYTRKSSYYHFILGFDDVPIRPNLIFCQYKLNKEGKEEATIESYMLELFDATLPRYRIKKRLGDYVTFLKDEGDAWQEKTDTNKLLVILFVCPRTSDLIYAKRRTRGLIAEAWYWEDEDAEKPRVRFTTAKKIREHGLLAKEIWEQA